MKIERWLVQGDNQKHAELYQSEDRARGQAEEMSIYNDTYRYSPVTVIDDEYVAVRREDYDVLKSKSERWERRAVKSLSFELRRLLHAVKTGNMIPEAVEKAERTLEVNGAPQVYIYAVSNKGAE